MFEDNINLKKIDIRIKFMSFCFFLGFTILFAKLIHITSLSPFNNYQDITTFKNDKIRPTIVDRNGHIIASNIEIASVAIRPSLLLNKEDVIDRLLLTIPTFIREDLENKILNDKKFVWLKRGITPNEKKRIHDLGIPGLEFINETKRFYSSGKILSHVLGYVNIDNVGQTGIEKYIEKFQEQEDRPEENNTINLSIDLEVSHAMRDELYKAKTKYEASAAAGVLLDVNSGEVISIVSIPDFDPHYPKEALKAENINRITNGVYEIGSTFKMFTIAMALDSGIVDLDTLYDASKPISIGGHKIRDFYPENRELTISEIFTHSSNIGTAKIVRDFGVDYHKSFLDKLGMFDKINTQLPDLPSNLIPQTWREINSMTISFGMGISITPLHAAVAGSSLVNGGKLITPTFIKSHDNEPPDYQQILELSTSEKMKELLYKNVMIGSGKKAAVDGYLVGGKTGTANKVLNGRYDPDKRLTTFLGAFPIDEPQYILFLLLDEPQGSDETYGYATTGWNAAPTFSNIVSRIAPMLEIEPSNSDKYAIENIIVASNTN